jgi:23S rRNA pseudouridine955/2504/2580 synthase
MTDRAVFQAQQDDHDRRLDRVLLRMLPDLPVSGMYRLLRRGAIRVNGRKAAPDHRLQAGDTISLPASLRPDRLPADGPPAAGKPADGPPAAGRPAGRQPPGRLPVGMILLETPHLLALNKPPGWLVHGPGSLDERVLEHLAGRRPSLSFRPGPVHRLDRNTSGLLLFAASLWGATTLSALLREGRLDKYYLAVLDGRLEEEAFWEHSLSRDRVRRRTVPDPEGRQARLEVKTLAVRNDLSLALFRLLTGRTHQIRAQAALAGYPLTGDRKYGGSARLPAYLLHSAALRVRAEVPGLGFHGLEAPLPEGAAALLERLFGRDTPARAAAELRRTP